MNTSKIQQQRVKASKSKHNQIKPIKNGIKATAIQTKQKQAKAMTSKQKCRKQAETTKARNNKSNGRKEKEAAATGNAQKQT